MYGLVPTKDHLFHRLVGGTDLVSASMRFISKQGWHGFKTSATWDEDKSLAQHVFTLLERNDGYLLLSLAECDIAAPNVMVTHRNAMWTIDGVQCIVSPPKLDFNTLPRGLSTVEAKIYSKGTAEDIWLEDTSAEQVGFEFDPGCEETSGDDRNGRCLPLGRLMG